MAGNESDLLKQATQAMMARYERENTRSFRFGGVKLHAEAVQRAFDVFVKLG